MIKSLTKLITFGALTFASSFTNALQVDSFFDIFVDVGYDKASNSPYLIPQGRIIKLGTGVRKVETEMLSMSLSSHRNASNNGMNYHATVAIRSWVPNSDGQVAKVDSFFDIIYTCASERDTNEMRCSITSTTPKTKGKHRGHVTVLK